MTRVALVVAMLFFVPAVAHAGSYDVQLCADPAATGFTDRSESPGMTATATCPPPANDPTTGVFLGVVPSDAKPASGASAAWSVQAPLGATLRLTVQRKIDKPVHGYEVAVVTAESVHVDGCDADDACSGDESQRTYRSTRGVTFRVRCASPLPCANTAGASKASLLIRAARATVDDPMAPTTPAPTVPAGWQRTATVNFSAQDNTGVRTISLRAGDRTLDTRTQTCDFRHLQPCPLKVALTATPDLPDGVHALTVAATDAGGEATTSPAATVKLDRAAPGAPAALAVERKSDGTFVYTWRNPDQGPMAPIVAARLSDGTVVRGANLERLEAKSGDLGVYLEDEAGNADAATTTRITTPTPITLQRPILQQTARSAPNLKLTSATRSGTRLVIKGTIARQASAKVVATLTRGKRSASASAKPSGGRFTIRLTIPSALRRKGTNTLKLKFAGQGDFAPATVSKRLAYR